MLSDIFRSRPLKDVDIKQLEKTGQILEKQDRNKEVAKINRKNSQLPNVNITKSLISLYSWSQMQKNSTVRVDNISDTGKGSIWDDYMGPAIPLEVCAYCGQLDCPGHYGLITFRIGNKKLLVYNPSYIRNVISVLRCVCYKCSKLIITEDIMREQGFLKYKYEERLKILEEYCKKILECQNCGNEANYEYMVSDVFLNGEIRKYTMSKATRAEIKRDIKAKRDIIDKTNDENNGDEVVITKDPGEVIPIKEIYEILNKISEFDAHLLGFTETNNDLIIRVVTDILYLIVDAIKFLNVDILQNIHNLLKEKIEIEEWYLLLDSIKLQIDKLVFDILRESYLNVEDVIINNIEIINEDLSNRIIDKYQIPKYIKRSVNNIIKKLPIENLIEDLINIFNENNIGKIIEDRFNSFISKIKDRKLKQSIRDDKDEYIKIIIDNYYSLVENFNVNVIVKKDLLVKSHKIDSLLFSSHPRDMIMNGMLVTPRISRPRIFRNGKYIHSSISYLYLSVIKQLALLNELEKERLTGKQEHSARLARRRNGGKYGKPLSFDDDWKLSHKNLYIKIRNLVYEKRYFKAVINKNKIDPLSIIQLIQGKNALIRHGMMSKIVEYCGRTVISPDPSLRFGQIRIPEVWAHVLTKRVTVTKRNKQYLQGLFLEGKITHVTSIRTGIMDKTKRGQENKLIIGDIVHRWLMNGDRISVNRQPTLQKQSMMKFEVVLGKELTIGLHLSYTTPMNADFDGDEANGWDPQDIEVEAETEILMNVNNNIISMGYNRPSMGLVMNSITGSYLISKLNYVLNKETFRELLQFVTHQENLQTLNSRLKKYGINPFSGQAILSAIFPPGFYYNQKGVVIIDGILISGRLKKSSVGVSHRSIIQDLYKSNGKFITADFFTDASWIINKWILERGFSVGLLDMINLVIRDGKEEDKNLQALKFELAKIYNQLETLATKLDDPLEERFRQRQIVNLSNVTTGIGIKLADDVLTPDNSIAVMTEKGAGTKGAVANIGQMMGAVGQQFIYGERIAPTITGGTRTLPTYDENTSNPEAHGFIPTSFFTGLDPEGLFFLQAGGRPPLLDTALNTQDTGALEHRMIKAFENIVAANDGSVRNGIGTVFAPVYNGGYNIGEMLLVDNKEKSEFSSFIDIRDLANKLNLEAGWIPKDVNDYILNNKTRNNTIVNDLLPIGNSDDTTIVDNIDYNNTNPKPRVINEFEYSRVIGARAKQLENDSKPLIEVGNEMDNVRIAMREFDAGVSKIDIVRKYSNATSERIKI